MTDEPITPPTPLAGGLTTGQIASARVTWLSHGYDPAAFDAAASGTPAPTGDTGHSPDARPVDVLSPSKLPTPNAEQVAAMRETWLRHGYSAEAFDNATKADGIALDTPSAEQVAQAEHNADWGVVARDPSEYRINYLEHGGRDIPMAELAAVNTEATSFLANLKIDPALGASIVERSLDVAQNLKAMSADQKALWMREQKAIAERRAGGPEKAAERVADIAHAIRATGAYGPFVQGLLKAGAFDDAWVFESLANHGARIKGWQAGPRRSVS
jgi:hypothetical protein